MPFISNFQNKYESFAAFGFKIELTLQNSCSQPLLLISAQHLENSNKFQFIVTNSLVRSQIKELCTNTREFYQVLADGFGGRSSVIKVRIDSNGILQCTYRKIMNYQDQERTFQIELNQHPIDNSKSSEGPSSNSQKQLENKFNDLTNRNKVLEKQNADLLNIIRSQDQEIARLNFVAATQTKNQVPVDSKPVVLSQNHAPSSAILKSLISEAPSLTKPAEKNIFGVSRARELSIQNDCCQPTSTQAKNSTTQNNPVKNPLTGQIMAEVKKPAEQGTPFGVPKATETSTQKNSIQPSQVSSWLQTSGQAQNSTTGSLINPNNPFLSSRLAAEKTGSLLKSSGETVKPAQNKSTDSTWNETDLFRKSTAEGLAGGSQNKEGIEKNSSISTSIFGQAVQKGIQARNMFGDFTRSQSLNSGALFGCGKATFKQDFVFSEKGSRVMFTDTPSNQSEAENSDDCESVYTNSDTEDSFKPQASENEGEKTGTKIIFTE